MRDSSHQTYAKTVALPYSSFQRTVQNNVMMNEKLKNAKVTVSIGVVKIPSGDIMDIEKILNTADMRMYKAKTNGKNASCMN